MPVAPFGTTGRNALLHTCVRKTCRYDVVIEKRDAKFTAYGFVTIVRRILGMPRHPNTNTGDPFGRKFHGCTVAA